MGNTNNPRGIRDYRNATPPEPLEGGGLIVERGNPPSTPLEGWSVSPYFIAVEDVLINPRLTINQRAFSGTWSSLSNGDFGWDRWRKDGTDMVQPVREGNYEPEAVYYLYGTGVTSVELTAPVSGVWEISVPQAATEIHLVLGSEEVPVRRRTTEEELMLCQTYYLNHDTACLWNGDTNSSTLYRVYIEFPTTMIRTPSITTLNTARQSFPSTNPLITGQGKYGFSGYLAASATSSGGYFQFTYIANAEI